MSFSAVKNNVKDARTKVEKTGAAESASSGESDIYTLHRRLLASFGVQVDPAPSIAEFAGIPVTAGAQVVLKPSFGCTVQELKSRFPSPDQVLISDRSTLIIEGDVVVESLELDGALVIVAEPGKKVVIQGVKVGMARGKHIPR